LISNGGAGQAAAVLERRDVRGGAGIPQLTRGAISDRHKHGDLVGKTM